MKNLSLLTIVVGMTVTSVTMTGCGSRKQMVNSDGSERRPTIGEVTNIPCIDYDTDEYYVGVFSLYGSQKQLGRLGSAALSGARQQLIEKMAHDYNGFVEQSSDILGNNKGNDVSGAIKSAGLEIIKQHVGRLRATCGPIADKYIDENGNITVYVSMRMYVKDITKALADNLEKQEKDVINFNHEQAMKKLNEYMRPTE